MRKAGEYLMIIQNTAETKSWHQASARTPIAIVHLSAFISTVRESLLHRLNHLLVQLPI